MAFKIHTIMKPVGAEATLSIPYDKGGRTCACKCRRPQPTLMTKPGSTTRGGAFPDLPALTVAHRATCGGRTM